MFGKLRAKKATDIENTGQKSKRLDKKGSGHEKGLRSPPEFGVGIDIPAADAGDQGDPHDGAVLLCFETKELARHAGTCGHLPGGHGPRLETGCAATVGKPGIIGDVKAAAFKAVDLPFRNLFSPGIRTIGIVTPRVHRNTPCALRFVSFWPGRAGSGGSQVTDAALR